MPDGHLFRLYDHKHPDIAGEFARRGQALVRIRAEQAAWARAPAEGRAPHSPLALLKAYYKDHLSQFMTDWGCTFDPRNPAIGLPTILPFVLFPKQVECVEWIVAKWRAREPGLIEKSRDIGISWLTIGLACSLCLFFDDMRVGFGSRGQDEVDKTGEQGSLLQKAREFVRLLPVEFRGGWTLKNHAPFMRLQFPETGSTVVGDAGDNIGRGDRTGIYFVDEAAHLLHPKMVDAALSATTDTQIDMSSVNGLGNAFAEKRHSGRVDVFIFDWRDDPRKDDAWYEKKKAAMDPVIFAQEVDRDYSASVEGVVIPAAWVRSAVDADVKCGVKVAGDAFGALDIADEGKDRCAFAGAKGVRLDYLEEWSGKGSDVFATVERAFTLCDRLGYKKFRYDGDGIGAAARGDAKIVNERREERKIADRADRVEVQAFRGSDAVDNPTAVVPGTKRTNEDFFKNRKAQAWWALRERFRLTHLWVTRGIACDPSDIVVIDGKLPLRERLIAELSQPTYQQDNAGKVVIDKLGEGIKSPDLADAVMMRFAAPFRSGMVISADALRGI